MQLIDYVPLLDKYIKEAREEQEADLSLRRCMQYEEIVQQKRKKDKRKRGDVVADDVLETLDKFGVTRTPGQKQFHKAFFNACLPHIYGSEEFEQDRQRILKRFGITRLSHEVLVVCPRRWGKTYSVSLFVAALIWCVPDMWVSIFSTGQRASTSLLELIAKWIKYLQGNQNRVQSLNQERLYVRGNTPSDVRRCYSYPSSVQVRSLAHEFRNEFFTL